MTYVLLLVALTLTRDDPTTAAPGKSSPAEEFRALRDAHQAAYEAFVKADNEAKTDEDRANVREHPGGRPHDFMPPFLELAKKHPGTTAAEDALLWIATQATSSSPVCQEAKRLLARDFAASRKLGPALGYQGHYADDSDTSEAFFRAVLAANPDRDLRGLAAYWLARHLLHKAERARRVRDDLGFARAIDGSLGEGSAGRLRRLDPDALESESEALLERVAKFHAATPHNDKRRTPGTLGEAARSFLRERRELAVGNPAPEIEGTALDGRPFRLKDQRGKVVLLDFGSHFYCGLCREAYPGLRELTKRLGGRPFFLVSINAEPGKDLGQLKKAWTEAGNTWPCLFDGDWEGPIQTAWNITRFPTVYVVGAKGIIRLKGDLGGEYPKEIEKLVIEAETAETK
jgi:thiol-disulfide isomerase/thioredoxin